MRITEGADGQDLLGTTLALAQTQLASQIADETSVDARTMGTLGFTGALLAVDIASKDVLGVGWWAPLIPVGLAMASCLRSVLEIGLGSLDDPDFGPGAVTFYSEYRDRAPRGAREQLLADLVSAFGRNAHRVRAKRRALRGSLLTLAIGLAVSTLVVVVDDVVTNQRNHAQHVSKP